MRVCRRPQISTIQIPLLVLPVPCASEMGSRECRAPLRRRRRMCAGLACKSVTNKHGSPPLPQTIETPDWSHIHPRSHVDANRRARFSGEGAGVRRRSESLACEWRRTSHARPHDPGPTSPDRFRAPKHRSPRSIMYEKPAVQRFGSLRELTMGSGPSTGGDATSVYHRS